MSEDKNTCVAPTTQTRPIKCLEGEGQHLTESLPDSLVPTKPISNYYHRMKSEPQCDDDNCGQRLQFVTMQGHEIRMMDSPSGACNITLTTSDASQSLRLDQMNKITWLTSQNHHFIMADAGHTTSHIGERSTKVKYADANNPGASTYQLLMTEKKHKIWLADTETHQRIHACTIKGNEMLLLDASPDNPKGKIQVTTYDKKMQVVMDMDSGDIQITNNNTDSGSIKMYAHGKIELYAKDNISLTSEKAVSLSSDVPVPPGSIMPTVKSNLEII